MGSPQSYPLKVIFVKPYFSEINFCVLFYLSALSYEPAAGDSGGCVPTGQDLETCDTNTCVKCKKMWRIKEDKNLCEIWYFLILFLFQTTLNNNYTIDKMFKCQIFSFSKNTW